MSYSFLIVEDEVLIAQFIRGVLSAEGHNVAGIAHNANAARTILETNPIDCILLDINIDGKEDGLQFARNISHLNIPIIFISAYKDKNVLNEAAEILPYGFLTKPFDENNLLATIVVVASRIKNERASALETQNHMTLDGNKCCVTQAQDDITLDHNRSCVLYKNKNIALTKKEFMCLSYLLENQNTLFCSKKLQERIWEEKIVSEATLRELINRLRKKVPFISVENVYGQGYICSTSATDNLH